MKKEESDNEVPQVRPWVRYFARSLDYVLFGYILLFIAVIIFPALIGDNIKIFILSSTVGPLLWIPFEALFLCTLGTTPGKWFFKTRITDVKGNKLTFNKSFKRSLMVWFKGMGMGLPFISFMTNIFAYMKLDHEGKTSWDEEGNFKVSHRKIGAGGITLIVIVIIVSYILSIFSLGVAVLYNNAKAGPAIEELLGGNAIFKEFANQQGKGSINLEFNSSLPINVQFVPTKEDYEGFMQGDQYGVYPDCSFEEKMLASINCTVSTGGVIIYNPNEEKLTFQIRAV